jgi:hypothetical protein
MILCACTFSVLFREETPGASQNASQSNALMARFPASLVIAVLLSVSLLVSGGYYVWSGERLSYAKIFEGEMVRSTLPQLAGLSVRGSWIPEFEGLVRFTQQQIPMQDGLLMIPGEDLFYYTTGRRPQFPSLMFDHTVNPFSPEEIRQIARNRNIRWFIVKNNLQLNGEPVEEKDKVLALLKQDFQFVRSVGIYDVYRRAS